MTETLTLEAPDGRSLVLDCRDPRLAQGKPLPISGRLLMTRREFDTFLDLLPESLRVLRTERRVVR